MTLQNDPLAAFWMPFTANRSYKANPRQLVSASGMFYQSSDGRAVLDGTSGLWCSNAGHCREEITAAIAKTAHHNGTTLREEAIASGLVSGADFDLLVDPSKMLHPN